MESVKIPMSRGSMDDIGDEVKVVCSAECVKLYSYIFELYN